MSGIFQRTALLYGQDALARFAEMRVGVFGLGGVGCMAAEAVARSGVGGFVLVDFDRVKSSNINRQLAALHSTLEQPKAETMRARLLDINPQARVEAVTAFADESTRSELLARVDVVVDAIDSLGPKTGLIEDALARGLPLISVMGAAGRRDPSKVRLDDLSRSQGCSLARRVRRYLRRRGIEGGFPVVYSTEQPVAQLDYEAGSEEEWELERGRRRGTLPSSMHIPAIMGLWAAAWVLERE
ncbi:MAG: tRNA threonylcarbamoyladenosine dehydratase [Candidatus Cloacimonetes bacterium]|nr:tRNA threonylcarbamoyladenosine dehydratase [Candidatus Cloacimonadota bacterium]